MSVETTLYDRLSGFTQLTDLVDTRISPNKKIQDSDLPAVSFHRVTAQRPPAMGADSGVVQSRFQIDCWAANYDQADGASAVRDAVIAALQRWSTTVGTNIFTVFIMTETDLYEDDSDQHHIAIDVELNYSE